MSSCVMKRGNGLSNPKKLKPTTAPSKVIPVEKNILSAKSTFNDEGKRVYDEICKSITTLDKALALNEAVSVDDLKKIVEAIQTDNPEFFWFENYSWVTVNGSQNADSIEFKYNCNNQQKQQKQKLIDEYYGRFSSGLTNNMSDYDKVKYTHDYIIKNTDYLANPDDQNISSVFIDGKSVCAGYSRATQYLLNKIGITNSYVSGEAINRGSHAWNIVIVEGECYYLDVTWDDPTFTGMKDPNFISYNYFCITTKELLKTHEIGENLIQFPKCVATRNNYFVKENLYFTRMDDTDVENLKAIMSESVNNGDSTFVTKYASLALANEALSQFTKIFDSPGTTLNYSIDKENFTLVLFLNGGEDQAG